MTNSNLLKNTISNYKSREAPIAIGVKQITMSNKDKFIDTHAHLNFKHFGKDLDSVILRAQKAGVKKILNIGTRFVSSQEAIKLAEKYSGIFVTVSLHPIYVLDEKFNFEKFKKLAKLPKVVAIGETGLDYQEEEGKKITEDLRELQRKVFGGFLKMAAELQKPVILHCRQAEDDFMDFLTVQNQLPKGVMHCFGRDLGFAKKILDLGFLISFTGSVTYNLSKKTRRVIEEISLDKIMIETDCPFMTPFAQRQKGIKRCEPAFVPEVAKKIAEIKKLPLAEVAVKTTKNAEKLFRI